MSVVSSHDILQANYLKSNAYIIAGHGPWQRAHNLLINVCSLLEFPKVALNSSTNTLKSFKNGDCHFYKGANHVKVVPNSIVPIRPTWIGPFG
jgi:hypothetical protein